MKRQRSPNSGSSSGGSSSSSGSSTETSSTETVVGSTDEASIISAITSGTAKTIVINVNYSGVWGN